MGWFRNSLMTPPRSANARERCLHEGRALLHGALHSFATACCSLLRVAQACPGRPATAAMLRALALRNSCLL